MTKTDVRSLRAFWNEARLRADDAKSTSVRPAPGVVSWRAALEDILNVGYGLQTQCRFVDGAWEQVRWRTTPSAGALYPFEVIACVVGEGSYLWHVEAGRLVDCAMPPFTRQDLFGAGLLTSPEHRVEALVIVLARPWLGMKKYRQRGYPYCFLDVGHVTSNIGMYAAALGYAPTLHLRFSRRYLADHLNLDGLCREPAAMLSFASARTVSTREPAVEIDAGETGEPVLGAELARLERPEAKECHNWDSLRGLVSFDAAIARACVPRRTPLVREPATVPDDDCVPLPDGTASPSPVSPTECRSAILGRRSAKGFHDGPLALDQIGALLSALRAPGLPADCAFEEGSRLGVRLVARHVEGLSGVFAYAPTSHALHRLDTEAQDFQLACMKQRTAVGAAALLLFHASADRLLDGYSSFAESHFHAGQLGQRLHLAATRLRGVGMTCIGGFDGERCGALGRLDGGEEAVYVILLGLPDESGVKHDQLRVASSHGYTTEEG